MCTDVLFVMRKYLSIVIPCGLDVFIVQHVKITDEFGIKWGQMVVQHFLNFALGPVTSDLAFGIFYFGNHLSGFPVVSVQIR